MEYPAIPEDDEELARKVLGAAIEVHRALGPGFLESVYHCALCHELSLLAISFEREKKIMVPYKGIQIEGQRPNVRCRLHTRERQSATGRAGRLDFVNSSRRQSPKGAVHFSRAR